MSRAGTILLAVAVLGACGGETSGGSRVSGTLTVFAAASLTDAFTELGTAYEAAHPGIHVDFNFAGSSALAEQISQGAPADVLATADTKNLQTVIDAGLVDGDSTTFARNRLAIATPSGNPASITGLADFTDADLLIGLCAEEVPCGKFAREALAKAGVTASVDTDEPDVRALLTKIEAGELDAGIVYVTDVQAAGDSITAVEIPDDHNVVASYPIAALQGDDIDLARDFLNFVLSGDGQAILASHGFLGP